ncbi:hypothetical protein RB597_009457 [Gaeumannomyces tritici]
MADQVRTLWSLPAAPLVQGNLVGAIFVTIWLVVTLAFAFFLRTLLHRPKHTWPEFKETFYSVVVLAFWYFTVVLDRWMRRDSKPVAYGYIVWLAVCEFVRVAAGIYLQWGLYKVVWRELVARGRVRKGRLRWWWLAAKFAIALVFLLAVFYLVLQLTTAVVWLQFTSLNTIQDIATRRNQFAVVTAVFGVVFAALTAFAAANAMWMSRLTDGGVRRTRIALFLATVVLLARTLSEVGTTAQAISPPANLQSITLARDIAYGVLTTLYFILIGIHAAGVSRPADGGNEGTRAIHSNMRKHILAVLHERTGGARERSPELNDILHEIEDHLDTLLPALAAPPGGGGGGGSSYGSNANMSAADNRRAALDCLRDLRTRVLPGLQPRDWREEERARDESLLSRVARSAVSGMRRVSDQSLLTTRSSRGPTPAHSEAGLLAGMSTSSRGSLNPNMGGGGGGSRTQRQQQMRQTSNQSLMSGRSSVRNLSPTGPTTMQQFDIDPIPEHERGGGDAASVAPSLRTAPSIFPPASFQQQARSPQPQPQPSFQARQQQQQQQHNMPGAFPSFESLRRQQQQQPPPPQQPPSVRSSVQFPPTPAPASIMTPSPPPQATYAYPPVGMTPPPQSMYGGGGGGRYGGRGSATQQQQQHEGRRPAAPVFTVPPDPVAAAAGPAAGPSMPGPLVDQATRGERHASHLRSNRAAENRYARPLPSQTRSPLGEEVEMMDVRRPDN